MQQARRIVVITEDVLAPRMAGPAIRALHIAEVLSEQHVVTLISTSGCDYAHSTVQCRFVPLSRLRHAVQGADPDVVVFQGFLSYHAPWLMAGSIPLVIDMYDPVHLEQLEQLADRPELEQRTTIDYTVRTFNEQAARGDFFICASEDQRALWLGLLGAFGRINIDTYRQDVTLRRLIDTCPFGIAAQPPVRNRRAIKGVVPGIGPDDRVLIWAGGIYNWFDPVTLIRAVHVVSQSHPDIRLFFLGTQHPNPGVPAMAMAVAARNVADELGLTGRHVFFNEGWVEYGDRHNYLLDADAGVSSHFANVETLFSFRTRMLDYLWAGLPMISTEGDTFGRLIAEEGLGLTVPQEDVDRLAAAIRQTVYDQQFAVGCRARVRAVAQRYTWENTLAPLVAFCANPVRAADAAGDLRRMIRRPVPPAGAVRRRVARTADLWREGGARMVVERTIAMTRRVVGERSNRASGSQPPAGERPPV